MSFPRIGPCLRNKCQVRHRFQKNTVISFVCALYSSIATLQLRLSQKSRTLPLLTCQTMREVAPHQPILPPHPHAVCRQCRSWPLAMCLATACIYAPSTAHVCTPCREYGRATYHYIYIWSHTAETLYIQCPCASLSPDGKPSAAELVGTKRFECWHASTNQRGRAVALP